MSEILFAAHSGLYHCESLVVSILSQSLWYDTNNYIIIVQVKLYISYNLQYLNRHADSGIAICCKNACVHGLSESKIVTTRDTVWAMNHKEQEKWLLAHFAAIYSHNTRQFTHTVCGKPLSLP